jgi:hypothetical protein
MQSSQPLIQIICNYFCEGWQVAAYKPKPNDRARVESMTAVGIPQDDMAKLLGISAKTLRKHFPDEVKNGMTKANMVVGGALYRAATTPGPGQVAAAIFWTKARMGWREPSQSVALTGAAGGPIEIRHITRTIIEAKAPQATAADLAAGTKKGR